jgi:hypothetical protein
MTLRLTTSSNQTTNVNNGENTYNIAVAYYQQLLLLLQNNFYWVTEKIFWFIIGMIPVVGPAIKTIKSTKERDFCGACINAGLCFADILSWGYGIKYEIVVEIIRYFCYTSTIIIELKRYLPYLNRYLTRGPMTSLSGRNFRASEEGQVIPTRSPLSISKAPMTAMSTS